MEKSIPITELLLHQDLPNEIRRKSEPLINYFFPPDEMKKTEPILPNLDEIIKLSMFHEYKQENINRYKLGIISTKLLANGTKNFMEKCIKDNRKRLIKTLRQFIFDSNNNRNISSVQNFSKIAERAILYKEEFFDIDDIYHYNDQFNINVFVTFLIKNSLFSPYLTLLETINYELYKDFPFVITETLRYAAISCLHIIEDSDAHRKFIKSKQDVYLQDDDEQKREENLSNLIETQPVNCECENIPFPYFLRNRKDELKISEEREDDQQFIENLKKEVKFDDLKEGELFSPSTDSNMKYINFSYNLIKTAYTLADELEFVQNNEKIIFYLLICGTQADSFSNLSYAAFNLLFNIFNKCIKYGDLICLWNNETDKFQMNLNLPKIVDEFADHFTFDSYQPTEKMISALLVFWNHRYKNKENNVDDKCTEKVEGIEKVDNESGVSAMELLLPAVLTEPIYSNSLVNIFIRIVKNLELSLIKLNKLPENKEICFQIDSIWFRILSHKFKLSPDDENFISLHQALQMMLPLSVDSIIANQNEIDVRLIARRTPTNPVFLYLSELICHGAFFTFNDGTKFRDLFEVKSKKWAIQTMKYKRIIDGSANNALIYIDHA